MQPQQPDRYTHNNRQNRKILQAKNSIVYIDEAYYEFSGVTAVKLLSKYKILL